MNKVLFSIIILTYNGEKTIGQLLRRLTQLNDYYTKEIIIIDSESIDKTLEIVKKFKNQLNIRIYKIKKKDFNHGLTRNYGVSLAKGKHVWFISQDAIPINKKTLDYIIEDFKISNKVQVVFCPHRPYKNTPLIQRLEQACYQERILKYLKNSKILIQNIKNPFIPLNSNTEFVWYMLSNTCAIYKKSFLLKNPFPNINFGEDLAIGQTIINNGFIKVFDSRFSVLHSHIYNLFEYFQTEKKFINSVYLTLRLKKSFGFFCKIKKILSYNIGFLKKIYYLLELFIYYLIKVFILIQLKFGLIKK